MILISLKQKREPTEKIHFFIFQTGAGEARGEVGGGEGKDRERRGPELGESKRMRPVGKAREMNASSASTKKISSCSRLRV